MAKTEKTEVKKAIANVDKTLKGVEKKPAEVKAEKVKEVVEKAKAVKPTNRRPSRSEALSALAADIKAAAGVTGKDAVTVSEMKAAKKVATKVRKEGDLGRRLITAKSSLMAGVEAAVKGSSVIKDEVQEPVKPAAKPALPPSFSMRSSAEPVQQKVKPAAGKVAFSDLIQQQQAATVGTFDIEKYVKK